MITLYCPKCNHPKWVPDGKTWDDFYGCDNCKYKTFNACDPSECDNKMHWKMCPKCAGFGLRDGKVCKECEGMEEVHIT